jgi:hypothetical protein
LPGLLELDPAVAHIYVELVRRGARQLDRGQAGDVQHRLLGGAIDTAFGASGYVNAFNASGDKNYKFTSLCIVPSSRDIIVAGQETTSSGTAGVAERLRPPTRGSGMARQFQRGDADRTRRLQNARLVTPGRSGTE